MCFFFQVQFDLVVAAFTLSELRNVKEREEAAFTLWRKTSSYLVRGNTDKTDHVQTMRTSLSPLEPWDFVYYVIILLLPGAGGKWDQRRPSDSYGGQRHFIKCNRRRRWEDALVRAAVEMIWLPVFLTPETREDGVRLQTSVSVRSSTFKSQLPFFFLNVSLHCRSEVSQLCWTFSLLFGFSSVLMSWRVLNCPGSWSSPVTFISCTILCLCLGWAWAPPLPF